MDGRPAGELAWLRESQCDGGACVEAAAFDEAALVRNSLNPRQRSLIPSRDKWLEFLVAAKAGRFYPM